MLPDSKEVQSADQCRLHSPYPSKTGATLLGLLVVVLEPEQGPSEVVAILEFPLRARHLEDDERTSPLLG